MAKTKTTRKTVEIRVPEKKIGCCGTDRKCTPLSRKDFEGFDLAVDKLLKAWFKPNDSDIMPVDVHLVDRTRCESYYFTPIPYSHKAKTIKDFEAILDAAQSNLISSAERFRNLSLIAREHIQELRTQYAEDEDLRGLCAICSKPIYAMGFFFMARTTGDGKKNAICTNCFGSKDAQEWLMREIKHLGRTHGHGELRDTLREQRKKRKAEGASR